MAFFARSRGGMDGGLDGGPPRFGFRLGSGFGVRPFFLPISPETYWDGGTDDDSDPPFWLTGSASLEKPLSVPANRTEPYSRGSEGRSQTAAASNLSARSTGTSTSSSNVMIWVDAEAWVGEISLASVVLSRGEFEPGALFPEGELPELTAILASLLDDWFVETTELPLPLSGPFQQITTLDPLDESSLALTATLLTVSSDPQPDATAGPASTSTSTSTTSASDSAEASLPDPPSWAGFVIGLDEAFEANRLAVRRWPDADETSGASGPRNQATTVPPPTDEDAAVDEAIQELDREPSPTPALDELLLRALEETEDEDPTEDKTWRDAIGPASLSLARHPRPLGRAPRPPAPFPASLRRPGRRMSLNGTYRFDVVLQGGTQT